MIARARLMRLAYRALLVALVLWAAPVGRAQAAPVMDVAVWIAARPAAVAVERGVVSPVTASVLVAAPALPRRLPPRSPARPQAFVGHRYLLNCALLR